jgi:hypothetical protein
VRPDIEDGTGGERVYPREFPEPISVVHEDLD